MKLPPHDIDAEEAVIGSLLIDGDAIDLIKLKSEDFYHEPNRHMFKACLDLRKRRESINQITLAQELARVKVDVGAAHLSHLISICPTSMDIEYYAQIVKRLAVSRQTISLASMIEAIGYKSEPDIKTGVNQVIELVQKFSLSNSDMQSILTPTGAGDTLLEMMQDYSDPKHTMSWGFVDMDRITSGIYPELIIIGARPGVGKTQLMLDIVENLNNKKILFATAEMSTRALLERKIARKLGVGIREIRKNGVTEDQMTKIVDLAGEVAENSTFYLTQGSSSQDIYNEAKRMKDTVGLDIVFVDYLQILSDCWKTDRENQNVRVGKACKTLKMLVNDLNIPVVLASQLNRGLEYRGDKHPSLSDLRDSGNIEQDADVIFLLYREEEERPDVMEISMRKNRQLGSAPYIELQWLKDRYCYGNKYLTNN